MNNNSMKLLFLSSMMMGSILSISSNSWLGIWMGLEINLLSIIPMFTNNKNMMVNESAIKYFIIQAMASTMLLISILFIQMKYTMWWEENISSTMIASSMMMKLGAAPFHFWLPEVMSVSSWINCLILMTWQKIAPMITLSYCIKTSIFTFTIIITSIIIGAMGGLYQTSLRQIMAYSSISHLGWMISSMMISENIWELYFIIYVLLNSIVVITFKSMNLFFLNQIYLMKNVKTEIKFMMLLSLLSLGGLPPMLGFLPKWLVMQSLINSEMSTMMLFMVMLTTVTLYYYMRISFSAIILSHTENSWLMEIKMEKSSMILSMLSLTSIMGLICTSNLIMFY